MSGSHGSGLALVHPGPDGEANIHQACRHSRRSGLSGLHLSPAVSTPDIVSLPVQQPVPHFPASLPTRDRVEAEVDHGSPLHSVSR